ncbi:MAG TPA: hypothetical protein PK449_03480 [Exilispira sp.]|nr:hypothetical protein [Exilispira sp.]
MKIIAHLINTVLVEKSEASSQKVKEEVKKLCLQFPLYKGILF